MKLTTFTIAFLFIAFSVSLGQGSFPVDGLHPKVPKVVPARTHAATERGTQFFIDYDYADYLFWGGDLDPDAYQYFIWNTSMRYKLTEGDTAWTYSIVGFDSLYDYNTGETIENDDVYTLTIDSIYMAVGHENNSGTPDTIILKIIKLASTGYPGSTILWSDTIIADGPLNPYSYNDWLNGFTLGWEVNYSTTVDKRFGVKLEYYGAKEDTFGYLAGFPNKGATGQCDLSAYQSSFYPASYSYWMQFGALVPTSGLSDVYYDCNGSGSYEEDEDGANFQQNISFWALVDIDLAIGVDEVQNPITNLSVSPNPASDFSQLSFSLKQSKNVKINVYDIAGRLISSMDKGNLAKGTHHETLDVSSLTSGVYLVAIEADGQKISDKLVVGK